MDYYSFQECFQNIRLINKTVAPGVAKHWGTNWGKSCGTPISQAAALCYLSIIFGKILFAPMYDYS